MQKVERGGGFEQIPNKGTLRYNNCRLHYYYHFPKTIKKKKEMFWLYNAATSIKQRGTEVFGGPF